MTQTASSCEDCEVFITKIRQQSKAFWDRLPNKRWKQIIAGVLAAGCVQLGITPHAEAHWWNRCYTRTHYVLPAYCGWDHYGVGSYSFPSYAHWYSFGPACYRPISYYHVYARPIVYRPIVYRPIVYRPIYYRSAVLLPSSHFLSDPGSGWLGQYDSQWSSSDISVSDRNVWVDDNEVWSEEQVINLDAEDNVRPIEPVHGVNGIQRSVLKPKTNEVLKPLTWEEALYGPAPNKSAIRFVAYQDDLNDRGDLEITQEGDVSGYEIVPGFSAESILIDEMVRAGNSFEAHQTLRSFVSKSNAFDHSLQLRNAVLSLFASKDPIAVELVLDRFNEASAAGAILDERALGGKISDYLASSNIDVANTLNEFSKLALRSEETSVSQLLIVATILRLDGEQARSKVFAQAAFDQAAEMGSLQWNSLIVKLLR
jgi:hypothetical protein